MSAQSAARLRAQGCIGQAMFATYLWRIGQPRLLSAGPAAEHGATADKQLAVIWMILVPLLLSKFGSGSLNILMRINASD